MLRKFPSILIGWVFLSWNSQSFSFFSMKVWLKSIKSWPEKKKMPVHFIEELRFSFLSLYLNVTIFFRWWTSWESMWIKCWKETRSSLSWMTVQMRCRQEPPNLKQVLPSWRENTGGRIARYFAFNWSLYQVTVLSRGVDKGYKYWTLMSLRGESDFPHRNLHWLWI